jgi:hypothetical protein
MSRFPFEEDYRHRFGEFEEWRGRYIFIGRHPCVDPFQPEAPTIRLPIPRRMRNHRLGGARPVKVGVVALPHRRKG